MHALGGSMKDVQGKWHVFQKCILSLTGAAIVYNTAESVWGLSLPPPRVFNCLLMLA